MPIYEYKCDACEEHFDVYRTVENRNDHGGCPSCKNLECSRVYTPSAVISDIQPYVSTIDGKIISSRNKHRAHLREHGCVEIGTESISKARKYIPTHDEPKSAVEDIKQAWEKCESNA